MGEKIATLDVKREKGRLYYVKSDAEGYLEVYKTELKRYDKKEKDKQVVEVIA